MDFRDTTPTLSRVDFDAEREHAMRSLAGVIDADAGRNIVELGLVQHLAIDADSATLTLRRSQPTCRLHDAVGEDAFRALQRALPDRDIFVQAPRGDAWESGATR